MLTRYLPKKLQFFIESTSGAVVVEWIVLTAAVAGLALVAVETVFVGSGSVSETASGAIGSAANTAAASSS